MGSTTEVVSSDNDNENNNGDGRKKRFLRSAVATAAVPAETSIDSESIDIDSGEDSSASSSSSSSSNLDLVSEPSLSNEIEMDEEFDYESYHTKHHIPIPALGATMMGLMNTNYAATNNDNEPTPQNQILEEDHLPVVPRGILAFAGTNLAMKQFASRIDDDDDDDDDHLGLDGLYMDETEEDPPPPKLNNALLYQTTLAQISQSRSSLLWGSDSLEEVKEDDSDDFSTESSEVIQGDSSSDSIEVTNTNNDALLDRSEGTTSKNDDSSDSAEATTTTATTNDSEQQTPPSNKPPITSAHKEQRLTQADSDLDRGRHLVGLEVREVRPHQQIIIDYQDAVEENMEEQPMRPLRITYMMLSEGEDQDLDNDASENGNNTNLEKSDSGIIPLALLASAFNDISTLWSQALSLPPVMGNIIPTVEKCGGATIPSLHNEEGVEDSDILIYVSGDNRFCGGALMHSAICDYDQHMRPLVANINICTENIPTTTAPLQGKEILPPVLDQYDAYIATETARILGASTSLFRYYQNPDTDAPYGSSQKHANCIDGTQESISVPNVISDNVDSDTGAVYYEIRTPKVIEVVRNHFDCMTLTGARLEVRSRGSISCFGGFLDERLFFGEQASGVQISAKNKKGPTISPLTLALLEDSSWYIANYTISTEIPFGRGAGCQFSRGGCAVDNGIVQGSSTQSKGFHCSEIGTMGCDVSHSFKARCDLLHPTSDASTHDLIAGLASAQNAGVCPMYIRGAINCNDEGIKKDSFLKLPDEVYGKTSKCFLTDEGQPMCIPGLCNEETQTIDFSYKDVVFSCQHDGDIIDTKKGVRIECPRIAAVCPRLVCPSNCSGRGVCDEDREGKHTCICDDPFDESLGCWGQ